MGLGNFLHGKQVVGIIRTMSFRLSNTWFEIVLQLHIIQERLSQLLVDQFRFVFVQEQVKVQIVQPEQVFVTVQIEVVVVYDAQLVQLEITHVQLARIEVLVAEIQIEDGIILQEQLIIFWNGRQIFGGEVLWLKDASSSSRLLGCPGQPAQPFGFGPGRGTLTGGWITAVQTEGRGFGPRDLRARREIAQAQFGGRLMSSCLALNPHRHPARRL